MGILRVNQVSGIGTDGPVFDGVTKFDTQGYVVPPTGTTDQRSAGITTAQGTIRFNTDSQKLEFYAQDQWWEMVIDTPDLGVAADTGAGARGVFAGGYNPGTPAQVRTNVIQYVTISSTGNAIDFGDLASATASHTTLASSTRGVNGGGFISPANTTVINFITISSTGNSTSFGSLTAARRNLTSLSNATRGIFAGGYNAPISTNVIEYITIAETGSAVDFGDLFSSARELMGAVASPVRGVFAGGQPATSPFPAQNTIEYITISSLGNATDFGDLTQARGVTNGGCSNATRGVFGGGQTPTYVNTIDYITITTLGNAVKFGDLTTVRSGIADCSSSTRGVFGGGYNPTHSNIIDYVSLLTQGNAVDFGDLLTATVRLGACSNAHGGL